MARRVLPALLVFAAFLSDVGGSHGLALAFLLLGVPAAFALALECYGDRIDGRCGVSRPVWATLAVLLVVFSTALRSPAVAGGVPTLAVSTLVLVLTIYLVQALAALFAPAASSQRRRRRVPVASTSEQERLAA
jgi:hypothetical protein